jgi:acetyl esterase/lipase
MTLKQSRNPAARKLRRRRAFHASELRFRSMRWLAKTALLGAVLTAFAPVFANAAPLTYTDLLARKRPVATKRIQYGPLKQQFGDLYLPSGGGRHRVVVLIHGGCWLAQLPGLELMAYAAGDLRQRGNAVWSIEYRRLGESGGGYPGSFRDVADAIDSLRVLAKTYPLDLNHVVAVGHSAGGHFASWAAARARLPESSPLYRANPLPVARVVSLAGINDLKAYRNRGPGACGEPRTIDALVGYAHRSPFNIYTDTSPAELLPLGTPQTIISGALDPIVPAEFGIAYAGKAAAAGDRVNAVTVAGAGHFELIDPQSKAFEAVRAAIEQP